MDKLLPSEVYVTQSKGYGTYVAIISSDRSVKFCVVAESSDVVAYPVRAVSIKRLIALEGAISVSGEVVPHAFPFAGQEEPDAKLDRFT